jgi:ABC-type glycerol-3-phosphate transport system substrate-binding protein
MRPPPMKRLTLLLALALGLTLSACGSPKANPTAATWDSARWNSATWGR